MKTFPTAACLLPLLALGCRAEDPPPGLVERAELGVFYGGQVQERDEIAFEIDPVKQRHGFCIVFDRALVEPVEVSWEIDVPAGTRASKLGRLTRLGQLQVDAGERRVEQSFRFVPGDPLGIWNFRVSVDDEVVIDRAIGVYDGSARARALLVSDPL